MLSSPACIAAPDPVEIDAPPVLTPVEAVADRRARSRRHAAHCIQFAVVTSPEVSAELIDQAIALSAATRSVER